MTTQSNTRIRPIGMTLGASLAISFMLCTLFGLFVSGAGMYKVWLPLLPGVTWISWQSALLEVIESYAWGWYIALLYLPLYRYFTRTAA